MMNVYACGECEHIDFQENFNALYYECLDCNSGFTSNGDRHCPKCYRISLLKSVHGCPNCGDWYGSPLDGEYYQSCKHCDTPNALNVDSCRDCGTAFKKEIEGVDLLYRAFMFFGDTLTNYRLEYKGDRPQGDDTRFQAAARIASTSGGVTPIEAAGYYRVMSDNPKRAYYDVCALEGDFFCACPDGTYSKNNPTGYCKHILAALMVFSVQQA